MKNTRSLLSCTFTVITLLFICHSSHSFSTFKCEDKIGNAPGLPKAYSANIRINLVPDKYTIEMKYATNGEGKELIDFKSKDRHVKYITRKDQKSVLFIQYREDAHPTCDATKYEDGKGFLKTDDVGKNQIILKAIEVMMFPNMFNIYAVEPSFDTGVYAMRYQGCLSDPKINISMTFAEQEWTMTHTSSLVKNVDYPEMVVAEVENVILEALYSYFDPSVPGDDVFQPPADVFCDGFRADKTPPKMLDYFSYKSEMIVYESAMGIEPIVSHREVYYDYPAGISRMDFHDPLAEDADLFSKVTAKSKSIIHDFNAGLQYIFDPFTGKCTIDTFQAEVSAVAIEETKDSKMYKGAEYFWLDGAKTSYNGQFPIRGMMADVYTALRVDPKTEKRYVISWYFSTEETRVVENENVEKNVLLRMYVRPETDLDKEDVVEINFYNFAREEPNIFTYDLTDCYNETSSKILVFTFPAIDSLKGSGKLIGMMTYLAIKDATGLRKQRIHMKEVIFSGGYTYAEFSLLENSPIKGSASDKEISLDDALKKLEASVSSDKFSVNVPSGGETITLKPEPNGLNIFAGDRVRKPSETGYKEGSVIGLTMGMLILGFLLGGVTLNLVMSRKFGVSLFQKGRGGNDRLNDVHNESSM